MKKFNHSFLVTLITLVTFITFVLTSCKEDEPTGPEGALGKEFRLAVDGVTSSLASSIVVSADGTKILAASTSTNGTYYSSDGGQTFTDANNAYLNGARGIDNKGNILTSNGSVFSNGNMINSSGGEIILGDNGKVFSYDQNWGTIKYRNASDATDFIPVTMPIAPTPGSGGFTYHCKKAPGKGLFFAAVSGIETKTVKAYVLDEGTMEWSEYTLTFETNSINDCNNLGRYERFTYAGNDIVLVKGCSGTAMLDLATGNTTYLDYPDIEGVIDTDLRDGEIFIDDEKQVYVVLGSYADLNRKFVYRFNGSTWSQLDGYYAMSQNAVFTADQAGNVYYNTDDGAGESIRGAVKVNISSNEKTALGLPTVKLIVTDAIALNDNKLLITVENNLYEHDIAAGVTTKQSIAGVNHVNLLSDGRILAGGADKIYLSSNDGESWTEHDKVFSSVDPEFVSYTVSRSRIVNGKIMLTGIVHYYYDNLSTGVTQDKYLNVAVEFDGSKSSKLPYQFPGDFKPNTIGTDGTIYGVAVLYFDWQVVNDPYELKPNVAPVRLEKITSPAIITDSGLQMTIGNVPDGKLEVMTRTSSEAPWESTKTMIPTTVTGGSLDLRLSGDYLILINNSEVYISGN